VTRASNFTSAALATLAMAAQAQSFKIDDFEYGAFYLQADVPGSAPGAVQPSLPTSSVLGGERGPSTLLWLGSANSPAVFNLDLSGAGKHGVVLQVPADSTAGGGLLYPGAAFGGLGENFTARRVTGLSFSFQQDPGNGTLEISADGPAGVVAASISLTGANNYTVPLSSFIGPVAVFGDINEIFVNMFYSAGANPVTAELSDITALTAVPESAEALGVTGVALLSFGVLRRRCS